MDALPLEPDRGARRARLARRLNTGSSGSAFALELLSPVSMTLEVGARDVPTRRRGRARALLEALWYAEHGGLVLYRCATF